MPKKGPGKDPPPNILKGGIGLQFGLSQAFPEGTLAEDPGAEKCPLCGSEWEPRSHGPALPAVDEHVTGSCGCYRTREKPGC